MERWGLGSALYDLPSGVFSRIGIVGSSSAIWTLLDPITAKDKDFSGVSLTVLLFHG